MSILEVYKEYRIPPQLQFHQLQVAGVAKLITDNFTELIDRKDIIMACLLHDMGNIIKFDLSLYPEYVEPEGLEYWEKVQREFVEKYGNDEHKATYTIAKEIGVNEKVSFILENIGFSNAEFVVGSDNFELKIATYSDQRINFGEVIDMRARHLASRKRYLKKKNFNHAAKTNDFDKLSNMWRDIENQIFEKAKIKPEEITTEKVEKEIESLSLLSV